MKKKIENVEMSIKKWMKGVFHSVALEQEIDDYERYEGDKYDLIANTKRLVVTRKMPTPVQLGLNPKTLKSNNELKYARNIKLPKGTQCEGVISSFWVHDYRTGDSGDSYLEDSENNFFICIQSLIYVPENGYKWKSEYFSGDMRKDLQKFIKNVAGKRFNLKDFNPEKLIGKKVLYTWNGSYFETEGGN